MRRTDIFPGGLFWQLYPYLQTAVMIFFVLSGYVIAYVSKAKERDVRDYLTSRAARLYSVVIPALVLTAICDYIGMQIDREYYTDVVPKVVPGEWRNYSLSLFFVQSVWGLSLNPGTNGPFWSLPYEVNYYLIFAAFVYLRGTVAVALATIVLLIGGPTILSLLPVWLFGVLVFHFHQRNIGGDSVWKAICLSLTPLAAIIWVSPILRSVAQVDVPYLRPSTLADYFDGAMFALHLVFVPALISKLQLRASFVRWIRWLASLTFGVYLFHYPLLRLFSVMAPGFEDLPLRWLVVYGGPVLVILALAPACERLKLPLKSQLDRITGRTIS